MTLRTTHHWKEPIISACINLAEETYTKALRDLSRLDLPGATHSDLIHAYAVSIGPRLGSVATASAIAEIGTRVHPPQGS